VELSPFRDGLPEGKNKRERVSLCLAYLLPKHLDDGRPVLAIFIETLRDLQSEGDALRNDLEALGHEISTALVTSVERQRQESLEAKDYLQVARGLNPEVKQVGQGEQTKADVIKWFEDCGDDIDERAFRIALAVFNGARYFSFLEAARSLAERLKPPPAPTQSDDAQVALPSPIPKRRSERLKLARAEIEEVKVDSDPEASSIHVVKLSDPAYAPALLSYLWWEYVDWHDALAEWFTEYVAARTADMRTRAAAVVGAIATSDFAEIRERILIPWVRRNDRIYRAAISKALGVAVMNDERSAEVRGLLKSWASSNNPMYRWTAARAYAHVGLRYPKEALEQWRSIVCSEETHVEVGLTQSLHLILVNPLHMSIVDAITALFLTAVETEEHFRPVLEGALDGLSAWADQDEKNPSQSNFALPIFMMLTAILMPNVPPESGPEAWPPAMLYLVDPQDTTSSYRTCLADLFCRALRLRITYHQAIEALHNWLERVNQDTRYEKQMLTVLQDIASSCGAKGHILKRIKIYLNRWANHPHRPLSVAQRALAHLRA